MNTCSRCDRTEEEVMLLDAIYENEIVKICEPCSKMEDIPIIRKPNTFQLKAAERPFSVYERLAKAAGLKDKAQQAAKIREEQDIRKITSGISLDNLRKPKDYSKPLPKPSVKPTNLIENFHWQIMMARRNMHISEKQLAQAISESETAVKMLESGNLPEDSDKLISKIEQYLRINLRKGNNILPKPSSIKEPARVLKFDPATLNNITISDLQKLKQAKKEAEKSLSQENQQEASNISEDIEIIDLDQEDIKT